MEAHDDPTNLDSWLIGQLRAEPPPSRLGELLLDENAAAARIEELEALVAELRAQIPPQLKAVPAGHVLFAPTAHGYAVVEVDGPPPSRRRSGAARRAPVPRGAAPAARRSRATGGSACISHSTE